MFKRGELGLFLFVRAHDNVAAREMKLEKECFTSF